MKNHAKKTVNFINVIINAGFPTPIFCRKNKVQSKIESV